MIIQDDEKFLPWEKDYPKYNLWGNQRWAWEFLKRNEKFKDDCNNLNKLDPLQIHKAERDLASKYGLRRFRSYDESVKSGTIFLVGAIEYYSYEPEEENDVNLTLKPGQVAILFDINQTLGGEFEFEAQINKAKKKLKLYREELLMQDNKPLNISDDGTPISIKNEVVKNKKKTWSKNYIRHLKIIDERDKGTTWADVARLVFPDGVFDKEGLPLEDYEIVSKYHKMMKASLQKPEEYKSILLSDKVVSISKRIERDKKMRRFFKEGGVK